MRQGQGGSRRDEGKGGAMQAYKGEAKTCRVGERVGVRRVGGTHITAMQLRGVVGRGERRGGGFLRPRTMQSTNRCGEAQPAAIASVRCSTYCSPRPAPAVPRWCYLSGTVGEH